MRAVPHLRVISAKGHEPELVVEGGTGDILHTTSPDTLLTISLMSQQTAERFYRAVSTTYGTDDCRLQLKIN